MAQEDCGQPVSPESDSVAEVIKQCAERLGSDMGPSDVLALQDSLRKSYFERFDDFRVRVGNYLLAYPEIINKNGNDVRPALVSLMFGGRFGEVFQNVSLLCAAMGLAPARYNLQGIFFIWRKFVGLVNTDGLPEMPADKLTAVMRASNKLARFLLSTNDLGVREDTMIMQESTSYRELMREVLGDDTITPRELRAGTLRFLAGRLREEARDAGGYAHVLERRASEYETEADGYGGDNRYPRFVLASRTSDEGAAKKGSNPEHVTVDVEQKKEVAMTASSLTFMETEDEEDQGEEVPHEESWMDELRRRHEVQNQPPKIDLPHPEFKVSAAEMWQHKKEERRQHWLERNLRELEQDFRQKRIDRSSYHMMTVTINAIRDTQDNNERHAVLEAAYVKDCITDAQYKKLCVILFD